MTTIKCPNCNSRIKVSLKKYKDCRWLETSCWTCGYGKKLKDTEFDFIQPDHPFFKAIYGYDPIKEERERVKKREAEKEKYREELDKKYHEQYKSKSSPHSRVKSDEEKIIRDNVLKK